MERDTVKEDENTVVSEPKPFLSPEDYLRLDREAEVRSEYYAGQMYAMSGGTPIHAKIAANATGELRNLFRGSSCSTYNTDLRIHIPASGLYTYADCVVVCGDWKAPSLRIEKLHAVVQASVIR